MVYESKSATLLKYQTKSFCSGPTLSHSYTDAQAHTHRHMNSHIYTSSSSSSSASTVYNLTSIA